MFQSSLIESAAADGNRRTLRLPFGTALALHGVAILAIVGASVFSPGDPPGPPARIVFVETRISPAAGGRDQGHASPARPVKQRSFAQPIRIPRDLPASNNRPDHSRDTVEAEDSIGSGAPPDGVPGAGSGPGKSDGVAGGTGEPLEGRDVVIPASSATEMPVLIVRQEPAYPDAARRIHSEGLVVLEAVISVTGVVENVRVVKSVNPLLDAAAVVAVEHWRYRSATLNGRAVRVALSVTVRFSLH
ncbi:MAG: TonB family protein [Acidobacteriota bacterium]|nr:TonB family protein [Acidobacteriota bacterium]